MFQSECYIFYTQKDEGDVRLHYTMVAKIGTTILKNFDQSSILTE